jgi:hypothetical protein
VGKRTKASRYPSDVTGEVGALLLPYLYYAGPCSAQCVMGRRPEDCSAICRMIDLVRVYGAGLADDVESATQVKFVASSVLPLPFHRATFR